MTLENHYLVVGMGFKTFFHNIMEVKKGGKSFIAMPNENSGTESLFWYIQLGKMIAFIPGISTALVTSPLNISVVP